MLALLRLNDRFWPVFTLVALLAVSLGSLLPLAAPLPEPLASDKLHHFLAYVAVALPVALARPRFWFVFVIGFALWGIVIELLQPLAGRDRSAADVASNTGGLVLAIAVGGIARRLTRAGRLTSPAPRRTKPAPGSSAHGRR